MLFELYGTCHLCPGSEQAGILVTRLIFSASFIKVDSVAPNVEHLSEAKAFIDMLLHFCSTDE
jgi:hypothetical protein